MSSTVATDFFGESSELTSDIFINDSLSFSIINDFIFTQQLPISLIRITNHGRSIWNHWNQLLSKLYEEKYKIFLFLTIILVYLVIPFSIHRPLFDLVYNLGCLDEDTKKGDNPFHCFLNVRLFNSFNDRAKERSILKFDEKQQ